MLPFKKPVQDRRRLSLPFFQPDAEAGVRDFLFSKGCVFEVQQLDIKSTSLIHALAQGYY